MRRPLSPRIQRLPGAADSPRTHASASSPATPPTLTPLETSEGIGVFLRVLFSSAAGYALASSLDLAVASTLGTGALLLGGTIPGGLALGYLQWLGMRERVADRRRWMLFSILAWTVGNPLLLSIITPGRILAFTTHALLVSYLRPPGLGRRRTLGLTLWIGGSVFGAVVNGHAIEVSRQGLEHGLRPLLVLALGSGALIAAMQALVFSAIHGNFALTAERFAAALGGVGQPVGTALQPDARMRWLYATARTS